MSLSQWPNSVARISSTRRIKLTGTVDGITPTREYNKHTKPSIRQAKYLRVKGKHSEETQSIPNKTDGK